MPMNTKLIVDNAGLLLSVDIWMDNMRTFIIVINDTTCIVLSGIKINFFIISIMFLYEIIMKRLREAFD